MTAKVTLNGTLLFPSDYIAAVEFDGKDVVLTIASIKVSDLKLAGGATTKRPVLSFKETKKKLVLNKTNASTIAGMYGNEAAAWAGKRITLYPTTTQFGSETVACIRVRDKIPAAEDAPLTDDEKRAARDREAAESQGELGTGSGAKQGAFS